MIDISTEELIPLSQVPDLPNLPKRRGKAKLAVNTVYTWSKTGLRGQVLETTSFGGTRCTTLAALMRFFEALSLRPATRTPSAPSQKHQALAHDAAKKALARFGIDATPTPAADLLRRTSPAPVEASA